MYTLIMCIGFAHGVCEQVVRVDFPSKEECYIGGQQFAPTHPEFKFYSCNPNKDGTSAN